MRRKDQIQSQVELVHYIKDHNYLCDRVSCEGSGRIMVFSNGGGGRFVNAINAYGVACPFQEECSHFPLQEPKVVFIERWLQDHAEEV